MTGAGCKAAVMEVSSHALAQERTRGLEWDVAVFTNLTQDHLDFHQTMANYFEAKARLFTGLKDQPNKKAASRRDQSRRSATASKLVGRLKDATCR